MPGEHPLSDVPSRYRPPVDHLAASTEAEMIVTFAAIKRLIGGTLPCQESVFEVSEQMPRNSKKYPTLTQTQDNLTVRTGYTPD